MVQQWTSITESLARQAAAAAAAKSLQSCPTLCDPIDGSPPGSAVPGIFQARTLEWVAISFSKDRQSASQNPNRGRSVVSDSVRPHRRQPTRLLCPWDFPGKSTGVGCHCLLQRQTECISKTKRRNALLAHAPNSLCFNYMLFKL